MPESPDVLDLLPSLYSAVRTLTKARDYWQLYQVPHPLVPEFHHFQQKRKMHLTLQNYFNLEIFGCPPNHVCVNLNSLGDSFNI